MVQIFFIILATCAIALYEIPPLLALKLKKELFIFIILLLSGTVFGIIQGLRIPLPNPFEGLAIIFEPLTNIILGLFE
jgi:hypothetical protein